jgi:hypothetical protein
MKVKDLRKKWAGCQAGLPCTLLIGDYFLDLLHCREVNGTKTIYCELSQTRVDEFVTDCFSGFRLVVMASGG